METIFFTRRRVTYSVSNSFDCKILGTQVARRAFHLFFAYPFSFIVLTLLCNRPPKAGRLASTAVSISPAKITPGLFSGGMYKATL